MDALARYYTHDRISQLLVEKLNAKKPKKILDLAIGEGSLSLAAFQRWNKAKYYGVDIDDQSILNIKQNLPFVEVIHHDSLEHNFEVKLNIENSSIDIAICNPPYLKYNLVEEDKELFNKVYLKSCISNKYVTTDIIFLAKNLFFLKDGCELGIILPDSVLTNHYYKDLRAELLLNHNIKCVIQLPDNIFFKAEARTHIFIIQKNRTTKNKVEISKADSNGVIVDSILVDKEKLIQRMDYDFHIWNEKQKQKSDFEVDLKDIVITLARGNKTRMYLNELGINYFHTTSFNSHSLYIDLDSTPEDFPDGISLAGPNDILIARVGKRCIGKVAVIRKGYIPYTDCIYRLQVQKEFDKATIASLISEQGQTWFKAYSHGVCARVISKVDLLNFRVNNRWKL